MAKVDKEARTVSANIVYWGPVGSGKWTNLECIHRSTSNHPDGEAIAANGAGVFETVKQVTRGLLATLRG